MNFVHLRTISEFSLTQGTNTIGDLAKKSASNNMGALALTDKNGMFGSLKFYEKVKEKGIKPIIGCDLTIEQEDGNNYQLIILAKNRNGYVKLTQLVSRAFTENRKDDKEKISVKEEWLAQLEDVIVLSGAKFGLIGQQILKGNISDAVETAKQYKDFFGQDFYIELQRDATEDEDIYMEGAVKVCEEAQIAPVATHPCFFGEPEDFIAHEVRYCIGNKETFLDLKRQRPFNKDMYFKTQEEMIELFSDIPQAIENTEIIAKKCNINLTLNVPQLPEFKTPNGENVDAYFTKLSKDGLEFRLEDNFPNIQEREEKRKVYEDRLNMELEIIKKMKFPGYFLIVSDFINWAKDKDIPVGPGRGSGAGSLVAYSMGITDLDPIPYNLFFERFLNPDRVSMPDFDIDFCQDRRDEVIEYVRQKYGVDSVSQICTFGTMAAKAVVRDVGRALGHAHGYFDDIAKMVNIFPNKPITLKEFIFGDEAKGIEADEKLLARYNDERDVKKLIDIALKLEGLTKQIGTGAAGVVISPSALTDFTPLYTLDIDSKPVSQYEISDVEKSGLVKFDFLGLRNLTIIQNAVKLIDARYPDKNFNLAKIPLDDKDVYKNVFANGNTTSVFQFESKGMRTLLQKANPDRFEDIVALVSLFRPGPMEIIPDWIEAKNTPEDQRIYPHPLLKNALQETYGYMIYQEQVMECARIIAGYSLGGADLLRRAMGKKKPEEMQKQRQFFIEGAAKNGVSEEKATELFNLIDKFSGYGFNKSHAAAYSLVAYQTGYLKNKFPVEYLTANLNSQVETLDTDKIAILHHDCKENNIDMLPPDINSSNFLFSIENNKIRYGLGALKGVGNKAAILIQEDREKNGPYVDFFDFLERVGRGNVNKRVLEALVKSGALDCLNPNRAQLFETIAPGLDYVTKFRKKQMENVSVLGGSLGLFDAPEVTSAIEGDEVVKKPKKRVSKKKPVEAIRPELVQIEPWNQIIQLQKERESLGYYFSSNPYSSYYIKELDGLSVATPLHQLQDMYDQGHTEVYVGALVEEIKLWNSKKGAFVRITDGITVSEISMFADFLTENKDWLRNDTFISMKVKLQYDHEKESIRLTCNQGFNFEQTRKMTASKIFVGSENLPEKIEKFTQIANNYEGADANTDVVQMILCLPDQNGRRSQKVKTVYVRPEGKLLEELSNEYGAQWVKLAFKKDIDSITFPENTRKPRKGYAVKRSALSV